MKAVILAGGLGSRLRPFTEAIPKPLMPLGEKAILEIQIERLKQSRFTEIYLATNYKSDYIENFVGDGSRYGVKLIISKEDEPLGTVGPLTLLKKELDEPFLVMNGDILTLLDFQKLYQFSIKREELFTVTIKKETTPFSFGNIFFKDDVVVGFEEKPDIVRYILAGIYVMKPQIFNLLEDDKYYNMDSLIKDMLEKQMPISKYEIKDYWLDIGKVEDYEKGQDIYESYFQGSDKK